MREKVSEKSQESNKASTGRSLGLKVRMCENSFGYHRDKNSTPNFITAYLATTIFAYESHYKIKENCFIDKMNVLQYNNITRYT